ncbi:MAG: carbohydrate ABC transporter permease [Lachnospiraceae bacterium]|nr:carbohydrate ABC transporter permease [Lachnospiraceae bacterium]
MIKRKKRSREDWIMDSVIFILSIIVLLITIYPFYYIFILSFNEGLDASRGGIYWWARKFTLENYQKFLNDAKWIRGFFMSLLRTVAGTLTGVLFTTLVSYGLSFRNLVGRKWYMVLVIVCMYFSGGIIPYYMVLKTLHLIDTFWVYIVPGAMNLFFVTVGMSFFDGIPPSLRESAKIDGAGELRIFSNIILPISKPFLATLALFVGVGHWNNWYDSAFFIRSKELRTLSYLMIEVINTNQETGNKTAAAFQSASTTSLSVQLTAMVISVVPIMCVYPFLQKYFVGGMMIGAVKE